MTPQIVPALTPPQLAQVYALRHQVFVLEQGVPQEEEKDGYDDTALHFLVYEHGAPVATARLVRLPQGGKVGRVAVAAQARQRGLGRVLMHHLHAEARALGMGHLYLDAQIQVVSFYERLGYVAEGPEFWECGIRHQRMVTCLT